MQHLIPRLSSQHQMMLPLNEALAGCVAGAAMSLVNCPIELLKVKVQSHENVKSLRDSVTDL